jgi:hypothetical protein
MQEEAGGTEHGAKNERKILVDPNLLCLQKIVCSERMLIVSSKDWEETLRTVAY